MPEGYAETLHYQDDDQEDHYRRLIARRDIDGHVQRYEYDSLGRVAKIIDPFGGETVPEYATTSDTSFPVGALKATALANGTQTGLQYDALGRMIRSELRDPTSALLEYLELTYNDLGQIEARERGGGGGELYTMEYDYDGAGRLTMEKLIKPNTSPTDVSSHRANPSGVVSISGPDPGVASGDATIGLREASPLGMDFRLSKMVG